MADLLPQASGYGGHSGYGHSSCGCSKGDDDGDLLGQLALLLAGAAAGFALVMALAGTGGRRKRSAAAGDDLEEPADALSVFYSRLAGAALEGRGEGLCPLLVLIRCLLRATFF